MPPCVEEVPGQKRKRKGASKLQDFHQWYLAACEWWWWWDWASTGGSGYSLQGPDLVPADQILLKDADHADSRRPRRKGPSFAGEAEPCVHSRGTVVPCHILPASP